VRSWSAEELTVMAAKTRTKVKVKVNKGKDCGCENCSLRMDCGG
jgi:hypothetical protein